MIICGCKWPSIASETPKSKTIINADGVGWMPCIRMMRNGQATLNLVMTLLLLLLPVVVEDLALYINVVIAAMVVGALPRPLPLPVVALIIEKPPQ